MKMSELYTFMNEHGGAKAFMFYWEVADECEDIQFGAEDSEVSAEDMEHYIQDGEPSPIAPVTDITRTVMYPITVNGKLYGIVQGKKKDHIVYCPVHWEKGKAISVYGYWWINSTLFGALDRLGKYLREAGIKCEVLADYVLVAKNDRKNNIHGLTPNPMVWLNRIGSRPVPVQLYEEWW